MNEWLQRNRGSKNVYKYVLEGCIAKGRRSINHMGIPKATEKCGEKIGPKAK
jgi:hypothetical protein